MVGRLILVASIIFLLYYTTWTIVLPLLESDYPINSYFASSSFAVGVPLGFLTLLVTALAVYANHLIKVGWPSSMHPLMKLGTATVVGISGVTCGGKTSLTRLLHNTFPLATVISQDDFFLPNSSSMPRALGNNDHANWDILESLDMTKMMYEIHTTLKKLNTEKKSLLFIDGFLIFNYLPLAQLCDLKYFLTLPYEECWTRRQKRTYDPPDPPGYFQNCAWPMYQNNFQQMVQSYLTGIIFLDGTVPLNENCQRIIQDVTLTLSKTW